MVPAFRQFTKSLRFGIRLFSIDLCLSLEKIISNVFAELEVHRNQYCMFVYLKEPTLKIIVLFTFKFRPYINLKS